MDLRLKTSRRFGTCIAANVSSGESDETDRESPR